MDPGELLLPAKFGEVAAQLDGLVRTTLSDEYVPFSDQSAPTISAGSLVIPRIQIDPRQSYCLSRSRWQSESVSCFQKQKSRHYDFTLTSSLKSCQQIKKRKLPYADCEFDYSSDVLKKPVESCKPYTKKEPCVNLLSSESATTQLKWVQKSSAQKATCGSSASLSTLNVAQSRDIFTAGCCTSSALNSTSSLTSDSASSLTSPVSTSLTSSERTEVLLHSGELITQGSTPTSNSCRESGIASSVMSSDVNKSASVQSGSALTVSVEFSDTAGNINTQILQQNKLCQTRKECCSSKNLKPIEIGTLDEKEMIQIIDSLIKAQNVYGRPLSLEELVASQQNFLKCQENKPKYSDRNVRSVIIDLIVKYFEQKIYESVRFAKRIPGFLELSQDDQANLMKESKHESDLISGMRYINIENKVFSTLDGQHFSLEDMKTVYPEETLQIFYEGARRAQNLHPSEEEEALLRAISITSADRCELQCKEKVEDIQNRLVSCLLYTVKKKGHPVGVRMGQLFDFLIYCRCVTETELKVTQNILLESDKHSNNPFIKEVILP